MQDETQPSALGLLSPPLQNKHPIPSSFPICPRQTRIWWALPCLRSSPAGNRFPPRIH